MSNKTVGFVYDDRFLDHITPHGHPERSDRLKAITHHLRTTGLWDQLTHITPTPATVDQLLAVHSLTHLEHVNRICAGGGGLLDEGDTHAVACSYDVALLAAGAIISAIDSVVEKKVSSSFCAVRPPGHHAERDRPMGFCLFNNVAVGARHAQRQHGVKRVAILDWDVHHGNGTQHIFEDDPTVFYISMHQYPFYPGTGARSEIGIGKGKGSTLNIPFAAGTGEQQYLKAFDEEVMPALQDFAPELLLISAGFDAHQDDPLGGMMLMESSFGLFTKRLVGLVPIVSVLEGGYNLSALSRSVEAHLVALLEG
ncbi:MAG: histone deacetylase [Bacteroidota bacterium]